MRVRFTSRAVEEIRAARDYYDEIDPALGERFLVGIDRVRERIEMFPRGAPMVDGLRSVRRVRVERFPYGVFYRLAGPDEAWVLRVWHTRRDDVDLGEG